MEIADEVLAHTAQIERSYGAPVLGLGIESPLAPGELADRAQAALATLEGADEMYWSVDVEPAGVVVRQWGRASNIGAVLVALAAALDSQGVAGRLTVYTPEPLPVRTPLHERSEELLECHVRVRGERRLRTPDEQAAMPKPGHPSDPLVGFFPDDDALHAGIEAALGWIADPPRGASLWSFGDVPHRDVGEVRAHLAAWLASLGPLQRWKVTWVGWWECQDRFRLAFVEPANGDVSFVEGGARLAAGDWEQPYSSLLDGLRAASGWGAYGLIKRGRKPGHAGRSLLYDWVPALHYGPYGLWHHIYEDVLAPDAFGAQLLGPAYAGRIPDGGAWERVDVGGNASLLLHCDPAAWFGVPLPPITQDDSYRPDAAYPTPDVILRAREDLAKILITADVVNRAPVDPLRG